MEYTWPDLVSKLGSVVRTRETMREYRAMSKEDQGKTKDIGGFVGGQLSNGHRKNDSVVNRSLITLDADNAMPEMWLDAELICDWEMVCYSTHSHTAEHPKLRFVIPLSRTVTPEEYEPIARKLAEKLGIEAMDPSTYEACRLMYWPSCPSDAEPVFCHYKGEWLDPDAVLAEYGLGDAWKDSTLWPIAKAEQEIRVKETRKMGDPTEKPGIVGLFCRAYSIEDAMDELIPGVYEPAGEGRYTYAAGSTAGGAVLYEGKFLYSHHGTDPCGGQLVNAFDLVRIHKYRELDAGQENQEVTRLPSYRAMCEFAAGLDKVKAQRVSEQAEMLDGLAVESVRSDEANPSDWTKELDLNHKTGAVELSAKNLLLILRNDPALKGLAANNLLIGGPVKMRRAPWDTKPVEVTKDGEVWSDADNAGLRWYLETKWGLVGKDRIQDALDLVRKENAFDPVQDYLNSLEWDGTERLDTMLIRWMGAEDNRYVRAVTRKWMCGAVARAMHPGCKFDNMLVLISKQGKGKSNLARALSKGWFTDSLGKMDSNKDSYERLSGVWIAEVAELSSFKKTDSEDVKNFITKQEDKFRKAYGRETTVYKRRCVFYASTNEKEFLRDPTGNRRFWPVEIVGVEMGQLNGFDDEVDQLWAEAVVRWKNGETLWINEKDLAKLAEAEQKAHTVVDEWTDEIQGYLDTPLPIEWEDWDRLQRREYFDPFSGTADLGKIPGTEPRMRVSGTEIRWELFGNKSGNANDNSARRIANIMNNLDGWTRIKGTYRDRCYGMVRGWTRDTSG